jgi:hypothetical protein
MLIKRNQRRKMKKIKNLSLKNLIWKKDKNKKQYKSYKIYLKRKKVIRKNKNIQ